MHLIHNEICIRDWTYNDVATILKWWNDGSVMAHAGFPLGLNKTREDIEWLIQNSDGKHRMIIEIHNHRVGELVYYEVDRKSVEIGIKICETAFQNKGYGTTILKMLITYLFQELCYDRIVLDTSFENTRARHVYEKLGFTQVAIHEDAFMDQLGNALTVVDYALDKKDWLY